MGASGSFRVGAGFLAGITIMVGLLAPSPSTAAAQTVEMRDDENSASCPLTNSFNLPTDGNCFEPERIIVKQGDTVTWRNTGGRKHDVNTDDGSIKGPMVYPGESWSYRFTAIGTFPYHCSLHGDPGGYGQAGQITVQKGPAGWDATPAPSAKPSTGRTKVTPPATTGAPPAGNAAPNGRAPVVDPAAPTAPVAIGPAPSLPLATVLTVDVRQMKLAAARSEGSPAGGGGGGSLFAIGLLIGGLLVAGQRDLRQALMRIFRRDGPRA